MLQSNNVTQFSKYQKISDIRGKGIKLGVAYQDKIKEDIEYKVDASYKLSNEIKTTSSDYFYSVILNNLGNEIPQDTLFYNEEIAGSIKKPGTLHTGIGVGKSSKWFVGLDFNTHKAWDMSDIILENTKFKYSDAYRFSVGGYYTPKANSISSYWERVTYRAGIRIEKPGISLNPNNSAGSYEELSDFGISFGLGLPIGIQLTKLNVSVEYGKRGQTTSGLIQENYINLRFGLNIAEKWFQKSKIN